jgi:hypothetical protein
MSRPRLARAALRRSVDFDDQLATRQIAVPTRRRKIRGNQRLPRITYAVHS